MTQAAADYRQGEINCTPHLRLSLDSLLRQKTKHFYLHCMSCFASLKIDTFLHGRQYFSRRLYRNNYWYTVNVHRGMDDDGVIAALRRLARAQIQTLYSI